MATRNPVNSTHQLRLVGSWNPMIYKVSKHPKGGWEWDFWAIDSIGGRIIFDINLLTLILLGGFDCQLIVRWVQLLKLYHLIVGRIDFVGNFLSRWWFLYVVSWCLKCWLVILFADCGWFGAIRCELPDFGVEQGRKICFHSGMGTTQSALVLACRESKLELPLFNFYNFKICVFNCFRDTLKS